MASVSLTMFVLLINSSLPPSSQCNHMQIMLRSLTATGLCAKTTHITQVSNCGVYSGPANRASFVFNHIKSGVCWAGSIVNSAALRGRLFPSVAFMYSSCIDTLV